MSEGAAVSPARPAAGAGPRGVAMLVAAAVLYGLIFPFNRLATGAGAAPAGHVLWVTLGSGLMLGAWARARGERLPLGWGALRAYAVVGGLGITVPLMLFTLAAPHLPAGLVSLVLALSPAATYLISVLVRIERWSALGLAGVALGFCGVAVIIGPSAALPTPGMLGWFLLLLATPLMLGSGNVAAMLLRPPAMSSVGASAGYLLCAAAVALPVALLTGQITSPLPAGVALPTLGAILVNAAFMVLFCEIVRLYGATFFAQFNYLAVVAAAGWAALILAEPVSGALLLALALMAAGIILAEFRPRR